MYVHVAYYDFKAFAHGYNFAPPGMNLEHANMQFTMSHSLLLPPLLLWQQQLRLYDSHEMWQVGGGSWEVWHERCVVKMCKVSLGKVWGVRCGRLRCVKWGWGGMTVRCEVCSMVGGGIMYGVKCELWSIILSLLIPTKPSQHTTRLHSKNLAEKKFHRLEFRVEITFTRRWQYYKKSQKP